MRASVYVFGHQNPDTDSICSSIAYAYLKNELKEYNAKAYRLGNINKETKFVLDYFGVTEPELLCDVKIKLKDLNLYTSTHITKKDPVKKAWEVLKSNSGSRLIPVVSKNNKLEGIVSIGDITSLFMETSDENIVEGHEILFENLVSVLEGKVVSGSYDFEEIEGSIYIGTTVPDESKLCSKDIIVTGKIENALHFANETKCGCVIITNDRPTYNVQGGNCAIVSVPHTIFRTVSMITHAISIVSIMRTSGVITFSTENHVDEIFDIMKTSAHRNFPVVDEEGKFVGVISRRHLIGYKLKRVILIDHNERSHSVKGVDSAEIVEIIDHHRIADIQTNSPLYIRSEPVGCTATIIEKMYNEFGVEINKTIAGLLLSAILSDTLMFSSPTCTECDKEASKKLAAIAGVDVASFGRTMFLASTSLEGYTPQEILSIDRKKFALDKCHVYISQINTLDFEGVLNAREGIIKAMEEFVEEKGGNDLVLLLVTDIIQGGSEMFVAGNSAARNLAYQAFKIDRNEPHMYLPDVVSRKKQVVPQLILAAANMMGV